MRRKATKLARPKNHPQTQMWVFQLGRGYFHLDRAEEARLVEAIEKVGRFIDGVLLAEDEIRNTAQRPRRTD